MSADRVQDQAAAYAAATAINDNMIARREIAARHEARQAAGVDFLESRMVYRAELDALDALEASP
ncbi:MAG: hypothetical protein WCP98_18080 [Actinomycetes bacterium]